MQEKRIIETWIDRDPDLVFDILVDLRHYREWLPHSTVFQGTTTISPGPIAPGTTYVESSIWGRRNGRIVELDRPFRVSYRQPMTLRPAWLGTIDVRVEDSLTGAHSGTLLRRTLRLDFQGLIRFFAQPVTHAFATEIRRVQRRLKAHAEQDALPVKERA